MCLWAFFKVGCKIYVKKKKTDWVGTLLHTKFFGSCHDHRDLRKNEKNVFCLDCGICCCKHCISSSAHCLHRTLQVCRYVYQDVIRYQDVHMHLDCSEIQTYKINGVKAIHLNSRPQSKDLKQSKPKGGASCEVCRRYIQDLPNRFCSIACKVSVVPVVPEEQSHDIISPSIRECSDLSLKETESSLTSEETQAVVCNALKPTKRLRERKGMPKRAPFF